MSDELLAGDGSIRSTVDTVTTPEPRPSIPAPPRKVGRPRKAAGKKAAPKPRSAPKVAAEAVAAHQAAHDVPAGPGRPSVAQTAAARQMTELVGLHALFGVGFKMGGDALKQPRMTNVGMALIANAESCSASLVQYGQTNESVRRALDTVCTVGGLSAVLLAYLPVVMAAFMDDAPLALPQTEEEVAAFITAHGGDIGTLLADASPPVAA